MNREERFVCASCAAYYEKVGNVYLCPKCHQERIRCAECAIAHSLHPKGGAAMINGGNIMNLTDPFVYCQKIKYYRLYSDVAKCKDFLPVIWNTTEED